MKGGRGGRLVSYNHTSVPHWATQREAKRWSVYASAEPRVKRELKSVSTPPLNACIKRALHSVSERRRESENPYQERAEIRTKAAIRAACRKQTRLTPP